MESLGIQHYDAFLLACVALALIPGLDTFYILARSSREGHAVGMAAVLGINAGCIVHTLAAVLGISAILMTSAMAFSVLKYLGAAYLMWIGLRMLLSRTAEHPACRGPRKRFRRRISARHADQRTQSQGRAVLSRLFAAICFRPCNASATWPVAAWPERDWDGHDLVDVPGVNGRPHSPSADHQAAAWKVDGSCVRHDAAGVWNQTCPAAASLSRLRAPVSRMPIGNDLFVRCRPSR
jgi:hypothetical protein